MPQKGLLLLSAPAFRKRFSPVLLLEAPCPFVAHAYHMSAAAAQKRGPAAARMCASFCWL